jgi:hypothetical protein
VIENNIMINNGFHPHCWYKHSADVVRRNIMGTDHYLPAGGMPPTPWGKELDYNLVHCEGLANPQHADALSDQSNRDEHSMVADALFVDPANGDFRVKDGSRKQQQVSVEVKDYAYVVSESSGNTEFKTVPLAPAVGVVPAKVSIGGAKTNNEPAESLVDGKVGDGMPFRAGAD